MTDLHRSTLNGASLSTFIRKHGEELGKLKHDEYRQKQAETNSLEYKSKKFGMSKEEFREYNLNRAATLENFIRRHGEELGRAKWELYCSRQSYVGSSEEYFIEKLEINFMKGHTLESSILRHGEFLGKEKYQEYLINSPSGYSKVSQELFWAIYNRYNLQFDDIYFAELNSEFGRMKKGGGGYKYDFVDNDRKIVIEFNGDFYHCNPEDYRSYDTIKLPGGKIMIAEDIWKRDKEKIDYIKNEGYTVIIIWEKDYNANKSGTVERLSSYFES
jgi:very-short-patch-repair endonuclease